MRVRLALYAGLFFTAGCGAAAPQSVHRAQVPTESLTVVAPAAVVLPGATTTEDAACHRALDALGTSSDLPPAIEACLTDRRVASCVRARTGDATAAPALYRAAQALTARGRLGEAINLHVQLSNEHRGGPFGRAAVFQLGALLEATEIRSQAAKFYGLYAEMLPDEPCAGTAAARASTLRALLAMGGEAN